MAAANTLPIELRRELVPVLRSGNFAGPGYAGGWGSESVITNAAINNGQPIQVSELVKTPQGLSQFMTLATQTEPNGYLDAVTRNHDVEYTVAEVRFMNKVQAQFDGKLPYELNATDKSSAAYQTLLGERNQEFWTADQRMLNAAVAYQPTDYADSTYRDLMVKGFYVKASDGVGGEYKLPQIQLDEFFNTLKAQDPSLGTPSTFGQKLDALGLAGNLARSDFEALATLPITPQEKAFFNSHLHPGDTIVPSDRSGSGETILWDQRDFSHSVVVPYVSPTDFNVYVAQVKIGDKEVTSYLDRTDKDNPVFTQEVRVNGALVSTETRIPVPETGIRTGENTARAYQVELRDGSGELQQSYTTEKPAVPKIKEDDDLQAKLLAVQTGNYSEVVAEIQTNTYSADAVNGMDVQSDQTHKANEGATQNKTDDSSNATQQTTDAFSQADKTAADIKIQYPNAVQVADASGALPDTFADTSAHTSTNTFSNFLDTHGSSLTPKQQDALATQIDQLNLGGEGELSFYSLPNGGALIANADGDIVGEIVHSNSGNLNLRATGLDTDGNTVEVSSHIQQNGDALTEGQYNAQVQQQATNMFNSLIAVNNWDHLTDVGKLSAFVNLYNSTDKLGEAFNATGDNLPGDLGAAAGYLQLAQGLQSGDNLVIANGINVISDGAVDGAMNQAFGTTAAGEAVPYLSYALAVRNFADNPEQAFFTGAGTYVGEAFGAALGGPIGAAIGGAIGGMIGGSLGSAIGIGGDDPPPSVGSVHFSWDAKGNIQHTIDFNQSGGGNVANQVAASVLALLEQIVQVANAKHATTADDIAINPYCLPKVSFHGDWGGATMEVTTANGQVATQSVNNPQFSEWLLKVVQDTGGILPAWQVQTLQMHAQQMREQSADEAQVAAVTGMTNTYLAANGSAVTSVQGHAAESADFKTQTFRALVVHLHDDEAVQAAQVQLNTVLRDIDSDGYFEKTQWVSATDALGNIQGVLAIDFNGDGQIETRDILNLGGNKGQDGNLTDAATQATQNANLQRNNVAWLDATGDSVIDKGDPAFAAIKLWVDANQDGKLQADEGKKLDDLHIQSINFQTGQITYADRSTDALTAAILKGDTEGVKLTQIQQADANGVLHALDAGNVLEHEGYEGQVQVTDALGTHWVDQRKQTFEQQAKRTGDWEGTAEQEAHRHGGGNVDGAPTQTTATGASDFGPLKSQADQTTQSTITESSRRVLSDAPVQAPQAHADAQTELALGDSRIKSNTATPNTTNQNSTPRSANSRVVFVPAVSTSVQSQVQVVTNSMIESAQSNLFGVGVNTGMGVLTAVALGAVQNVQAAEQRPALVSDEVGSRVSTTPNRVISNNSFSTTPTSGSTLASTSTVISSAKFSQVDLGIFNVSPESQGSQAIAPPLFTPSPITPLTAFVSTAAPSNVTASVSVRLEATPKEAMPVFASAANALSLGYPQVQAETLLGTEDVVLRLTQSVLLANDSTPNASADSSAPTLTITAVSAPSHGQVSLVNGEVWFVPADNFHGTASFTYTVTDQYGLSTNSSATLLIAAVNDVPVTQGESVQSDEDIGLIFTQAQLLANDNDVDVATDGQVLSISRVGQAEHGTVWLDPQGNLRFVPDVNYHGPAQFTYWVSDVLAVNGSGVEVPATVTLTVAAVNDIPLVQGESTDAAEDTTMFIDAVTLLANDTDADMATDGQLLSISAVSNAVHCTVNLVTHPDGTQRITFVPDANFHGTASFNYTVIDDSGGTAVATAMVNLSAINDAPVTLGETVTGDEDHTLVFTSNDLLANDTDVDVATDSQVLRISRVDSATQGIVTLDQQGQVHFTPDANYHGSAQFTYWVSDGLAANGAGAEVPATVTLTLLSVNDVPVLIGETVNTNEDTPLLFNPATLLANDTDVDVITDGQVLTVSAVNDATHGTVEFVTQPDDSRWIAFTPEANFFGVATYDYTVTDGLGGAATTTVVMNLAEVNDAPIAANDTFSNTEEDKALHISFASLLRNDADVDRNNSQWGGTDDVLTVSMVGNETHGSVAIVNSEVVFTPDTNYHGPASFVYQVIDSSAAVSEALATFSVTSVNDAPVAVGETISENEDTTLVINPAALLQNDSDVDVTTDGQVLSIMAVSNAQNGMVTLNANDTISFVPKADFYGNASFEYTVSDGNGGETTATATIALTNVNDAPVATGETVNSNEDEVLTITAGALLKNDSDIDNVGADLTISRVQSGTGGTVRLNASGDVVFTPTLNYNGTATFTYGVKDPSGLESNAVSTRVVLAAVNDAPSAQGEIVTGASEDAVFRINASTLLANDQDIDNPGSTLSLSWVGNATSGSASLDANGNVVFTPTTNFNSNATFQYRVRNAAGRESAVVQAVIPVMAVNDNPVAVDDQFTTYKNSTLTIAFNELTSNDTDVDANALTVSAVRDNANGHASIVNGKVQFVVNAGFTGAASFDYLTDDRYGGQAWATAFVDVRTPPNLYPTVVLTGTNFFGTGGPGIDVAYASWNLTDDSGVSSFRLQSYRVLRLMDVQVQVYFDANGELANGPVDGGWSSYTTNSVWAWGNLNDVITQFHNRETGMYWDWRRYAGIRQLESTWVVTDDKGLSNTWYFNYDIDLGVTSNHMEHSGYYVPPVILDMNGDGVYFTSLQSSNVMMDVNFDGIVEKMAWSSNDDAVLVWDKDQNHEITDVSEFSFQTLKADAQTDLEGLQALDTSDNGLLDDGDVAFSEFAVWQDANGNGINDAGEFKTLTELSIASINLHSDGQMRDAGTLLANNGSGETDATVMGNAAFMRTDGSTGLVADTMLAYEPGYVSQTAEIIRQAMLFNQVCNSAVSIDTAPLGFVPIQLDVQMHDMPVATPHESQPLLHSA